MRKILILATKNEFGMTDLSPWDYSALSESLSQDDWKKNVGNKVWMQGIISEITSENNIYDIGYLELDPVDINATYDCVILPMANIFSEIFLRFMIRRAEFLKKIKIPVYVIACGLQCRSENELPTLVERIGKQSKDFIDAVYSTGGEFCLRGNITKEFFDMLGNNTAVVTGCPSLFQMGRGLSISNNKVDRKTFKASLNSTFNLPISRRDFRKCDFIDQDRYIELLFRPNYLASHPISFKKILSDVVHGGGINALRRLLIGGLRPFLIHSNG